MTNHESVYEELLGELRRDQLGDLCAARLHRHVNDCQEHLQAAETSLKRALDVMSAAQRLQVEQTDSVGVAQLRDQLSTLLRMQHRLHQCMLGSSESISDASTESEEEFTAAGPLPQRRCVESPIHRSPRPEEETKEDEDNDVRLDTGAHHVEPDLPKSQDSSSSLRRPDLGYVMIHLQNFQSVQDRNATTLHIQKLLPCAYSRPTAILQQEWAWVRSMAKQIFSVSSFLENFPYKDLPPRQSLEILAKLVVKAFRVIVPGVTEAPVMLPMNDREFVALMMSMEQFLISFADLSPFMRLRRDAELLRALFSRQFPPVWHEWDAKCINIISGRFAFARLISRLNEWNERRSRMWELDTIMNAFDHAINTNRQTPLGPLQ